MESQVRLNHCLSAKNKFPFGGLKVLNSIQIDLIYILHPFTATFHNVAVIALPSFIIRGYRDLGVIGLGFYFCRRHILVIARGESFIRSCIFGA